MRKIVGGLLVAHGIVCLLGAFFPFYQPILLFYWFFPGPFALKLVMVVVAGAAQIVFGGYIAFIERLRYVKWYWLALAIIIIVKLLLVYPALNYLFHL